MSGRRIVASSYSLFLYKLKGHPRLQGLSFMERATRLSTLWANLPTAQKALLRRQASKNGLYVQKREVSNKGKSSYHKFVAFHAPAIKKKSFTGRIRLIARLWNVLKTGKQ